MWPAGLMRKYPAPHALTLYVSAASRIVQDRISFTRFSRGWTREVARGNVAGGDHREFAPEPEAKNGVEGILSRGLEREEQPLDRQGRCDERGVERQDGGDGVRERPRGEHREWQV